MTARCARSPTRAASATLVRCTVDASLDAPGTAGLGLVEVLAVTVIVGIAVIGVALMFGKGSAWVSATGADRVAAGLAQQRIEQIRACGWDVATADPPPGTPDPPAPNCPGLPGEPPLMTGLGVLPPDPDIQAGNNHTFTRTVCIQIRRSDDLAGTGGAGVRALGLSAGCRDVHGSNHRGRLVDPTGDEPGHPAGLDALPGVASFTWRAPHEPGGP